MSTYSVTTLRIWKSWHFSINSSSEWLSVFLCFSVWHFFGCLCESLFLLMSIFLVICQPNYKLHTQERHAFYDILLSLGLFWNVRKLPRINDFDKLACNLVFLQSLFIQYFLLGQNCTFMYLNWAISYNSRHLQILKF